MHSSPTSIANSVSSGLLSRSSTLYFCPHSPPSILGVTPLCQALDIAPNDAELHSRLGDVKMDAGDAHEAKRAYERAIELAPSTAVYHNKHAFSLSPVQLTLLSCILICSLLRTLPSHRAINVCRLGNAIFNVQEKNAGTNAMKCFRRALELDPEAPESYTLPLLLL